MGRFFVCHLSPYNTVPAAETSAQNRAPAGLVIEHHTFGIAPLDAADVLDQFAGKGKGIDQNRRSNPSRYMLSR